MRAVNPSSPAYFQQTSKTYAVPSTFAALSSPKHATTVIPTSSPVTFHQPATSVFFPSPAVHHVTPAPRRPSDFTACAVVQAAPAAPLEPTISEVTTGRRHSFPQRTLLTTMAPVRSTATQAAPALNWLNLHSSYASPVISEPRITSPLPTTSIASEPPSLVSHISSPQFVAAMRPHPVVAQTVAAAPPPAVTYSRIADRRASAPVFFEQVAVEQVAGDWQQVPVRKQKSMGRRQTVGAIASPVVVSSELPVRRTAQDDTSYVELYYDQKELFTRNHTGHSKQPWSAKAQRATAYQKDKRDRQRQSNFAMSQEEDY